MNAFNDFDLRNVEHEARRHQAELRAEAANEAMLRELGLRPHVLTPAMMLACAALWNWQAAFLFAAGLSVLTGLLFGLFPALHSTRPDLASTLKGVSGQPSGTRRANRFRWALVTLQITLAALAAAVVVGAGVILFDPIFQGLAISLMAGEIASLFLSRMAAETSRLRLNFGIILLALHQPLEIAEQLASLDVISKGRVIFGAALGYREVELAAFGVERKQIVRRFTENIEAIKRFREVMDAF